MTKIKHILAALLLVCTMVLGVVALTPAPASAGWACDNGISCGTFYHYAPDDGYDAAIMIACNWNDVWGSSQLVYEGQMDRCHDVDGVYVRPGTNIVCKFGWAWEHTYTIDGAWYKITDDDHKTCVAQLN